MTYLELALRDGHAEIVGEGKQQKVVYKAVDHIERYADPEEQVRAEFWAELIYGNPSIMSKVEKILQNCPQYLPLESKNISVTKKDIQITEYPADLHLILSIIGGGQELRDKLAALLP